MPSYRTPGVYIEEISGGPRPVAPSSTTDPGLGAIITLPKSQRAGLVHPDGLRLAGAEAAPGHAGNRAVAVRPLATLEVDAPPEAAGAPPAAEGAPKEEKKP